MKPERTNRDAPQQEREQDAVAESGHLHITNTAISVTATKTTVEIRDNSTIMGQLL
jgi:hypothetical protein